MSINNDSEQSIDIAERMVPDFHKGHVIYGEHMLRYKAIENLVKNLRVLDIASGSGYGSYILGSTAQKVYGVDISNESIKYAKKNYSKDNIEYIVGGGESIPLEDNSIDVVVTFETIEHIKDYKKFIKEVNRVLKSEGILIISTPNEKEFSEGNHFHLHEFEEKELEELLKGQFKYIKKYYQGDWIYSGLFDKKYISAEHSEYTDIRTLQLSPLEAKNYLYFYFICSQRKVSENISNSGVLSELWSARNLQEQNITTQKYISDLSKALESSKKHIKYCEEKIKLDRNHVKNLEKELDLARQPITLKIARKLKSKIRLN